MEGDRVWDADAFEASQRCWMVGADRDEITRRVLERAATRYLEKSLGMPGLFLRERCTGR